MPQLLPVKIACPLKIFLMSTVYNINKGVNRPIEFKGFKAQYIIYLAAGLVSLLLLFAILYLCGLNTYLCLAIIVPSAIGLVLTIQRLSKKYGEHGLLKKIAQKRLPGSVRSQSRKIFLQLKNPAK
jgi:hypothetical protein